MSVTLVLLAATTIVGAIDAPPPKLRYRVVLTQQETLDLTSLEEGTRTTERRDTVYAQVAALDSAGGHLVLVQLDSVAFDAADLADLPPAEIQQLRGAASQFFLAADGSPAKATVLIEGGGLSVSIFARVLDLMPRLRGDLAAGSVWSDSSETILRIGEDWRHSRYRTNYLVSAARELRTAFAGSHARLSGTGEVDGTSTGTHRWTLGPDRMPSTGTRRETQLLRFKDDELPAPIPITIVRDDAIERLR